MIETPILDELIKYIETNPIRYDVPGHKGNIEKKTKFETVFGGNIIKFDVNSMENLDNLNFPQGVIKKSQKLIAELHKADESKFLINGTTSGIQLMILASTNPGEKILVPRNVHKSVTSGIFLADAIPIYSYPQFDENLGIYTYITLEEIKKKLEYNPDIKVVLLINPTYYGVCSEFGEIVNYCKKKGKTVIVDEAHGGQFYFHDDYVSAMDVGADMSCVSYHKTLGSLTQSSLLLYNLDNVNIEKIEYFYQMLNTTSPSYLLMSSVEFAAKNLENNGKLKFKKLQNRILILQEEIAEIKGFELINHTYFNKQENFFDFSKILIKIESLGKTGFEIYKILKYEYNIQIELAEFNLLLLVTGSGENIDNFEVLIQALKKISNNYYDEKKPKYFKIPIIPEKKQINLTTPKKALYLEKQNIKLEKAINLKCGKEIMIYPPGIDIIKSGEIFTIEIIEYLKKLKKEKIPIIGMNCEDVTIIKE